MPLFLFILVPASCDFEQNSLCQWTNSRENGSPHPGHKADWKVVTGMGNNQMRDHTTGRADGSDYAL